MIINFDFSVPITWGDIIVFINAVAIFCAIATFLFSRNKDLVVKRDKGKTLFLVDGDNNLTEAIKNIDKIEPNDKVVIFLTQDGSINKLKKNKNENIELIKVNPGNQAVDNRIKCNIGKYVREGVYKNIFVVSHDKGYDKLIERYRIHFGLTTEELAVIKKI